MTIDKTAIPDSTPAARVLRGSGVDAIHYAAIAVVEGDSRLAYSLGDPQQSFFARSSIKPFQALPLIQHGGLEHFGFDDRELALCAASHSGSDLHRGIVLGMLHKVGLDESALQCGATYPTQLKLLDRYPLHGEDRDPLRHNCSGKHCGFLGLAGLLAQPPDTYLDAGGAVQRKVRAAVAAACEVDEQSLLVGIDGCSAPNFALSLTKLAAGFKNLARADAGSDLGRVRRAMLAHPLLISGEGRLDYHLSLSFPGRAVVKGGAEGLLLLGFEEPALGIAIKVLDGNERALGPLVVETLKQLGLIDDVARYPLLRPHEVVSVTNARKLVTGEVRAAFQLRRL